MSHKRKIGCTAFVSFLSAIISISIPIGLEKTVYGKKLYVETLLMIDAITLVCFVLSVSLFIPLFLLLFCKEAVYKSWMRFARIAFPLLVFLSFIFSGSGSGSNGFMSPAFISFSGEGTIIALSILFLFISLLIIIFKSWKDMSG